jgi:hypothetical protein
VSIRNIFFPEFEELGEGEGEIHLTLEVQEPSGLAALDEFDERHLDRLFLGLAAGEALRLVEEIVIDDDGRSHKCS